MLGGRGASSKSARKANSASNAKLSVSSFEGSHGTWDANVEGVGGGHIELITGPNLQYGLHSSSDKAYEAYSWNKNYTMGTPRVYTTLTAAKQAIVREVNNK